MRKSSVTRLPLRTPLPFAVYHESGRKLHDFGEELTSKHTHLMERAGITEVMLADRLDRPGRIQEDLKCKEVDNLVMARGQTIARPVYTDDGKLIVDSGTRVGEDIIQLLTKTGVKSVIIQKRESDLNLGQVTKYKKDTEKHIDGGEPIPGFGSDSSAESLIALARDLALVQDLESRGPQALRVTVTGDPLSRRLPPLDPKKVRSREDMEALRSLYNSCVARIESFFRELAAGHTVQLSEIDVLIADMLKATLRDRALLLALMHQPREGEYLFTHAVNVFTLVVNLAILLDYDERLLKEACYSAFFNDIGMLLVPDSIRGKTGKLSDQEALEVRNHTTYSVRLASKVPGIPEMLPLVVFQSHELQDGTGYPRQRKGDEIHDLAKVVSVADAYSAMISNRPYRKGERPYRALEEVIHLAGQRKYDSRVVRALLQSVNLFPVGSWVRLADGSMGVVVCPNNAEFARPWVRAVFDRNGKPIAGFPLISTSDQNGVGIDRAIDPPQGLSALVAFFRTGG